MDPGDWPGNLGAGLLPAPDGTCQGVFLRYDLFGGRGPAMIIGNLPEGSPAREVPEGQVPFEVAQLLIALENDEEVTVVSGEDMPVMQGDNLLIVRRLKLSESRIACVQFDRSDNVLVTIAAWDRPITDDLYALLKPLPHGAVPAELNRPGRTGRHRGAAAARRELALRHTLLAVEPTQPCADRSGGGLTRDEWGRHLTGVPYRGAVPVSAGPRAPRRRPPPARTPPGGRTGSRSTDPSRPRPGASR